MAVKFQDYYETLDVTRTATPGEIKLAFRKLARRHHPDVARNKRTGEAKFKELNEAYEVLGDPDKKRKYDALGADWRSNGFGFRGPELNDFFASLFAGRSGDSSAARRAGYPRSGANGRSARPGRDIEADILVTLEEAWRGSSRTITLRPPRLKDADGRKPTCQVKIPPGLREGQRIRLAGQGGAGHRGAAAGDLHLRVRFARHPVFKLAGDDLHCALVLAPWEAVLGVQVKIPTLADALRLRVPSGTVAGTRLRVRGQGWPREKGGRGNLYATVQLQVPPTSTAAERALWEKLAGASAFNPRRHD